MVELCELKLMSNGVDCWPPDIDQHVAQLDFGDHSTTSLNGQSSIFASMALDPSVISTDSMDMSAFRLRCENNKNDYKLTNFEDSGQWTTTSGIGQSSVMTTANNSPPSLLTAAKRQLILQRLQEEQEDGGGSALHSTVNHFGLALLEQLNNLDLEEGDHQDSNQPKSAAKTLMDNLLNHNLSYGPQLTGNPQLTSTGQFIYGPQLTSSPQLTSTGQLTTWGRIPQNNTSQTPHLRTRPTVCQTGSVAGRPVSLPPPPPPAPSSNNQHSSSCSIGARRPPSLLANFVEQQQLLREQQQPALNTTTPSSIQRGQSAATVSADRWHSAEEHQPRTLNYFPPGGGPGSRYAQATLTLPAASTTSPKEPSSGSSRLRQQRTFADLSPSCTAPDLKFLSMSHKVPSICRSSISMDGMLKKAKEGAYLTDCNMEDERTLLFEGEAGSSHRMSTLNNGPDSGLGSSSSSGPLHIEDWPSLAALLPRHVVDACSFFKTNTSLLTGSEAAASSPATILSENFCREQLRAPVLEVGRMHVALVLVSGVAIAYNHPTGLNHQQTSALQLCRCYGDTTAECCCTTSAALSCPSANEVLSLRRDSSAFPLAGRRLVVSKLKLHAHELSIVGLPIYESKRNLVERVVEGVAEIARGASSIVLWSALERLLADGLVEGNRPWNVIVQITRPGPATNNIFQLVKTLEASEKPENFRIDHFFREVLKLNSLEGWLSYVVLKENVLAKLYCDTAFLVRANTAYRSLFWRLVEINQTAPGVGARLVVCQVTPEFLRVLPCRKIDLEFNKPSLLEKAVKSQEARTGVNEPVSEQRPSTSVASVSSFKSCSSSRIPTMVSSPCSSTHCYGGGSSRPRSRSTLHQTSTLLSPNSTPSRSRSLLRALNGSAAAGSRIPVRVLGSSPVAALT
uniref:RUN domain-containing protein n=1 Tax=Ditylenchus dipsaci TaxID=166011 RepID=A0A915DN54_9BILA